MRRTFSEYIQTRNIVLNTTVIFCFPGVPTAPGPISVSDLLHDSCKLSWLRPSSDGGSPLSGYTVERRTTASPRWTRLNTRPVKDLSYHIPDMVEGCAYEYRVHAENKVGLGEPSAPTLPVIAKDPWGKPDAPASPRVKDISKRSCTFCWTPPVSDGGDAIRNYVVESRVVGTFKWQRLNESERTMDTTFRITDMKPDYDYEFRVAAENRGGVGGYSDITMPTRAYEKVLGNKPVVIAPLNDITVNAGNTLRLECDISRGKPKGDIKW